MKYIYYIPVIVCLLYACSQTKQGDLLEIQVDTNQDISLPLSEIAAEITAIELEMTDESLINPDNIVRFIITENNIIVTEMNLSGSSKVLVFKKDGKFVRSVGSRGQGPGEYNIITTVTFDNKSKRIYLVSWPPNKIICYDLDGKFLKESRINSLESGSYDINYINDELFLTLTDVQGPVAKDTAKSILYRMNHNFQVTDSCIFRENYYEHNYGGAGSGDYIVKNNTSVYLYLPEVYPKWQAPVIKVLRDTLYRIGDNHLIPELKLKFRNDGFDSAGDKIIDLRNIYRSSRYVFAMYHFNPFNKQRNTERFKSYYFCYDTKTGQGYNMLNGYTDDINGIEERVGIRPLHTDSEIFYYWHTNMKPDDPEEPNPTLYLIKLKK